MESFFKLQKQVAHLLGLLCLAVMIAFSVTLKERDILKPVGAQNLEATYHSLLIIESLRQNPIRHHWLLPTVTLGQENDAFIPWGATVPTKTGDYIYTSFTPPGFLLPYAVFEIFDLQTTVKNIARFNMAIGAAVCFALYLLILRLLYKLGWSSRAAIIAALTGVSIALFSREAFLSTGIIYWPHNLYQIILVVSLHLFFNILTQRVAGRDFRISSRILLILLFLGAWTEWTGYVFNMGLVVILWFHNINIELRKFALKVIVVTTAAGVVTLLHYGLAVGFQEALNAFIGRFLARTIHAGSFSNLISGYGLSYGLYLLLVLVILIKGYLFGAYFAQSAIMSSVLLASMLPLLENLIMLQHASQFSFDKLKFILPSAVVIAFAMTDRVPWFRFFVILMSVFAGFHGYKSHRNDMMRYSGWTAYHQENLALAERVKSMVDVSCATIASNLGVRGYANLLFGRSMYEYKSLDQALALREQRGGCVSIFLDGRWVFPDLPRYTQAILTWPDGRKTVLSDGDIK